MKHVQIINRKTIRLLLLIFVLTFCMAPVSSYADGPWTDRADQSIYDSTGDAPDSSTPDMLDGGIFAELLGEFCIGIGDGLNFLLTSFGCDLNAIIFGRVEVPLPAPGMWRCFLLTWGPATYMAWWAWPCMGTYGTWFLRLWCQYSYTTWLVSSTQMAIRGSRNGCLA